MPHPLDEISLEVTDFKCFGSRRSGFFCFQPINILIGRNNAGKSALIDAVEVCVSEGKSYFTAKHSRIGQQTKFIISQRLSEATLRSVFPPHTRFGGINAASHWDYGSQYVGRKVVREFGETCKPIGMLDGPTFEDINPGNRGEYYKRLTQGVPWPFAHITFQRIAAERNVLTEAPNRQLTLNKHGSGLTNLIRAFINEDDKPRDEVEVNLLSDLNEIYQTDCRFTRISCRETATTGTWEIFLREETKGDIRLSESGSSLKSVFIILCFLRLLPIIAKIEWSQTVLAIEEPENNLHPALLRRLLDFLAKKRDEFRFTLIIASHSPIGIDWSAKRSDSQIIHVTHDGSEAIARAAIGYEAARTILDDLNIRASDILQSNGIIWVEGPSDRLYVRKWIDLISDGSLREGVHYSIMFYGGRLLSHLEAVPEQLGDLISLLLINRNIALIMDSDFKPCAAENCWPNLNNTKRRIKDEFDKIGAFVWITQGREIENYIPTKVLSKITGDPAVEIASYDQVATHSTLEAFRRDKIAIARAANENTEMDDLKGTLDLLEKVQKVAAIIRAWNGLT